MTPTVRSAFCQIASKNAPAAEGPRVYTFIASDGDFDRYQDRLDQKGWKLEAFNKSNGVILYGHDDGSKDPRALPIGKGRAYLQDGTDGKTRLMVDVTFDQADDYAKAVERKVADGYLNCVSVRYLMEDYAPNDAGGFDC